MKSYYLDKQYKKYLDLDFFTLLQSKHYIFDDGWHLLSKEIFIRRYNTEKEFKKFVDKL